MKKRKIFRKAVIAAVLALGLLTADSGLRIVTTEYMLSFEALPAQFDGFRIVQLSDVHGAVFGRDQCRLLKKTAKADPNLIVITGDLADGRTEMQGVDALLAGLTALAPVYYVSGNHEWSEHRLDALQVLFDEYGVVFLRNEYVTLSRGGETVVLAGAEDPNGWRDMEKPDALCARLPEGFRVLLGHRNYWTEEYPDLPVDLIFCGHAHGGVVRLPGVGGLLSPNRELFPDYTAGVFRCGRFRMVVSRGLGSSTPVPRFLNNPELVTVVLKKV